VILKVCIGEFVMKLFKQILTLLLCFSLLRFTAQAAPVGPAGQSNEQQSPALAQLSPQELQQFVAPVALYPDALVAQILAASTYPTEIVEADRQALTSYDPDSTWHKVD
jgi:hypothetical protein